MLIGATLGRYFSLRFLRTILVVFGTVFALVYTLDFVELMRRAGDAEGASAAADGAPRPVPDAGRRRAGPALRDPVRQHGGPAPAQPQARTRRRARGRHLGLAVPAAGHPRRRADRRRLRRRLQPPLGAAEAAGVGGRGAHLRQRARGPAGKEIWIRQKSLDGQAIIRAEAAIRGPAHHHRGRRSSPSTDAAASSQRIEAQEATLHDGFWELKDARVLTADEQPQSFDTYQHRLESRPLPGQAELHSAEFRAVLGPQRDHRPDRARRPRSPRATGCSSTCSWRGLSCSSRWSSWPLPFR